MKKHFLVLGVVALLFLSGCIGGNTTNSNQNNPINAEANTQANGINSGGNTNNNSDARLCYKGAMITQEVSATPSAPEFEIMRNYRKINFEGIQSNGKCKTTIEMSGEKGITNEFETFELLYSLKNARPEDYIVTNTTNGETLNYYSANVVTKITNSSGEIIFEDEDPFDIETLTNPPTNSEYAKLWNGLPLFIELERAQISVFLVVRGGYKIAPNWCSPEGHAKYDDTPTTANIVDGICIVNFTETPNSASSGNYDIFFPAFEYELSPLETQLEFDRGVTRYKTTKIYRNNVTLVETFDLRELQ
ncbi:MAG TPA: hypothetical protein VFF13_00210 [archaeon]|nr:hypothetical protein [archaeon]